MNSSPVGQSGSLLSSPLVQWGRSPYLQLDSWNLVVCEVAAALTHPRPSLEWNAGLIGQLSSPALKSHFSDTCSLYIFPPLCNTSSTKTKQKTPCSSKHSIIITALDANTLSVFTNCRTARVSQTGIIQDTRFTHSHLFARGTCFKFLMKVHGTIE